MIKFLIMYEDGLGMLAHRMTKEMNGVQRNGGTVTSTNIFKDNPNLLTGVIFYDESKKDRINGQVLEKEQKEIMEAQPPK